MKKMTDKTWITVTTAILLWGLVYNTIRPSILSAVVLLVHAGCFYVCITLCNRKRKSTVDNAYVWAKDVTQATTLDALMIFDEFPYLDKMGDYFKIAAMVNFEVMMAGYLETLSLERWKELSGLSDELIAAMGDAIGLSETLIGGKDDD